MPDSASKEVLRQQALARRKAAAFPGFARVLAAHANALALPQAAVVSGYCAFGEEADPKALLAALARLGHPIALPRMAGKTKPLQFHRWEEADTLLPHPFGVLEPHPACAMVVPDVLLVPLLAFDAAGHRLGYGGGYYDRTLAALRAHKSVTAIGIAYAGQRIESLPQEPHDQPLDGVLTEAGLRRF